ncbi:ABC transporter permease [Chloroflexales bacterium ZM16-3]|nr:ABC transporter permease [Chloroflexales bacterium ZM16-3]
MATAITKEPTAAIPVAEPSLPILEPLGESGSSTVGVGEVVRLAFDSLLANKMRAFLTMLGVIIGVGSVVALLSIGGGASNAITSSVASTGTNVLTLMPGSPQNRGPGSTGQAQTLTIADADAVAQLGLPIIGPAPQYGGGAQVIAPAADANATITGIVPAYFEINSLTLQSGSYLDESQVRGSSTVVVLGANLANDLFGSGEAVGQIVRIKASPSA